MRSAILLLSATISSVAFAGDVKVSSASASSSHPTQKGVSYEPKNLIDQKASTVWVEGKDGSGLGEYIELNLGSTQSVRGFTIWNGNWYTYDFWERHNRPKEIEVTLSDDSKHTFELADEFKAELVTFPKPVSTSSLKIKVNSIHRGNTFNDTCISEVKVHDSSSDGAITPVSYASSSDYPADNDGSYEPRKMSDGLLDTMWCEGNKEGDGAGEWVSFDFGGSKSLNKMVVRNGNAFSLSMNMKGNRAKDVTLTFSDGTTKKASLKPSMLEQSIDLGGKSTSSVKVTFDSVMAGSEYNDLCISEMTFE